MIYLQASYEGVDYGQGSYIDNNNAEPINNDYINKEDSSQNLEIQDERKLWVTASKPKSRGTKKSFYVVSTLIFIIRHKY